MKWISWGLALMLCAAAEASTKTPEALRALASMLSTTQQIRLTLSDSAGKPGKHRAGYFVRYNKTQDTIAISPCAPGFFQPYPTEYALAELDDITVLSEPAKASPDKREAPAAEMMGVDCARAGEPPRRINVGLKGDSFDLHSSSGIIHCTFSATTDGRTRRSPSGGESVRLVCQWPGGDTLSVPLPRDPGVLVLINDCSIAYTKRE